MLAYLDRTPSDLSRPGGMILSALRTWARSRKAGAVRPVQLRLVTARDHRTARAAQSLFEWLADNTFRHIELGCPCCGRLSDDEALIIAAILAPGPEASRASFRALVRVEAIGSAVERAQALSAALDWPSNAPPASPDQPV